MYLVGWIPDKDYGYDAGARIRNYKLQALNDTASRFQLSGNFGNKSYLLVDFWGSWCEPCIKSLPFLINLTDELKGKVNVIGIACEYDNNTQPPLKILSEKKAGYKNYFLNFRQSSDKNILNELKILAYPTYLLLDRNLKIRRNGQNADEQEIQRLFQQKRCCAVIRFFEGLIYSKQQHRHSKLSGGVVV